MAELTVVDVIVITSVWMTIPAVLLLRVFLDWRWEKKFKEPHPRIHP